MPVGTYGKLLVKELADGAWEARARFRDYDGVTRQVREKAGTRAAAERALKATLVKRQGSGSITADTTIKALAKNWLSSIERRNDRATGTKQHYAYVVKAYVNPSLGQLRVSEVTAGVTDRALVAIAEKHGHAAARSARSAMSGIFGLAVRHDILAVNPTRDTSPITSTRKPPESLTPDQVDDLCDKLRADQEAVKHDLPDLVEWMLATGCRIGEACAARDAVLKLDFDKMTGTWEINATIIRVHGQGLIIQERPKTAAGWRVLALPRFAVAMVQRRRGELRLQGPQSVLFPSPRAKALRDPSNTPGDLRAALDRLGFAWVTSHTFRKTVATRLDEAGLTARQIADQLGHARPSMTQDVYMGRQVVNAAAAKILER